MIELPLPPETIRHNGQWQFGRYRQPFSDPAFPASGLKKFRLKQWHYMSFNAADWFLAFAVVYIGYLSNLFAYFVPKAEPNHFFELSALSPFARALDFAPSSVAGTTRWQGDEGTIQISGSPAGWHCELDLHFPKHHLHGVLHANATGQESMAMLHDFGKQRPGYTHKLCNAPTQGELWLDGAPLALKNVLAASDWTRGFCKHKTLWKWASFSALDAQQTRIGLNLSQHIYDNSQGESEENAYWINEKVFALGRVNFEMPKNPTQEPWLIHSPNAAHTVDLKFTPVGARAQTTGAGPFRSAFLQPFGFFSGQLGSHRVVDAFGVVEDHLARW